MQRACFLEGKLQLGSCTSSCPAPKWSLAFPWLGDKVAACPVPSYPLQSACSWAQMAPACPACSHHALDTLGLARAEVPRPSSPSAPCGCSTTRVFISLQVGAVRQEVPEPAPDEEICLQAAGRDLGRLLQAEHPRCHQLRGPGGGTRRELGRGLAAWWSPRAARGGGLTPPSPSLSPPGWPRAVSRQAGAALHAQPHVHVGVVGHKPAVSTSSPPSPSPRAVLAGPLLPPPSPERARSIGMLRLP